MKKADVKDLSVYPHTFARIKCICQILCTLLATMLLSCSFCFIEKVNAIKQAQERLRERS